MTLDAVGAPQPLLFRDLGEFGAIRRLESLLRERGVSGSAGPTTPIGDDAAVWRGEVTTWVATTDMLVEEVHFDLRWSSWSDVGWKALAVNLSDVAAMGAIPRYALVSLAFARETPIEAVDGLYGGMAELASRHGVAIVGGDTVRSSGPAVVNVALLGETQKTPLLRSVGRPGDRVLVTGRLGAAAGGLELLRAGESGGELVTAQRRPLPRVLEGRAAVAAGVRAGMDISDGLVADLGKLCAASNTRAEIEAARLPLADDLRQRFGERALELALSGGEDYELLLTCPPPLATELARAWPPSLAPLSDVGSLLPPADGPPPGLFEGEGLVRVLDEAGHELPLARAGYDAFGD